jgi:ADP-ribosylglycohydrolase
MVLASFIGDSHALGAHWIYDTRRIEQEFGRIEGLREPPPDSFHTTKGAGEFTHYGDQTLVLLESLAARGGFRLEDFHQRWQELFANYTGYFDQATKATLNNIHDGKGPDQAGSLSDELAGAARIAPLVFWYEEDPEGLEEAVLQQTQMTHNNPIVIQSGLFFAKIAIEALSGVSPTKALEKASTLFKDSPLRQWVQEGLASRDLDSIDAVGRFGQTCHVQHAFPDVIHFISKYENNLKEALINSVMAGGDSAGRGLIIGMILGAYLGSGHIPENWTSSLKMAGRIQDLLDTRP